MASQLISNNALRLAIDSDLSDSSQKRASQNLLDAINDWPTLNLTEPIEFLRILHKEIGDNLTAEQINTYCLALDPKVDNWKAESCTSLKLLHSYNLSKTLDEIIVELSEFYLSKIDTWDKKIIVKLLSYQKQSITKVNDYRKFIHLFFDKQTYLAVVSLIEKEDWENIKSIKQEKLAFKEDLILVMFTDQDGKNCLATIYDNDELWQDPEIIDVFTLQ